MTATQRLALPFISPGQAQKELFHNEALQTLDVLIAGAVEEAPRASPPAAPAIGSCYIVSSGATGIWTGHEGEVAAYTPGGWRYIAPVDGMTFDVRSSDVSAVHRNGGWELGLVRASALVIGGAQVVGARASAIADPAGGTSVDSQARTAVGQILAALRHHGLIAS